MTALKISKVTPIVKGADVLVRELTVGVGEEVPWHRHSEVNDWIYCLEGVVQVELRDPPARHRLEPGQSTRIAPGLAHRVTSDGGAAARYLLVQGRGRYDFLDA